MAKKQNWVRTGGPIGSEAMTEQGEFNDSGAGVEEVCKDVPNDGASPNEGVNLIAKIKGAE